MFPFIESNDQLVDSFQLCELKRRAEEGREFGQPPPSGGAESWY